MSYPCVGCDGPDATETLWLDGPLGMSCVWVHRDRECAEAARAARGGGRFIPEPTDDQKTGLAPRKRTVWPGDGYMEGVRSRLRVLIDNGWKGQAT